MGKLIPAKKPADTAAFKSSKIEEAKLGDSKVAGMFIYSHIFSAIILVNYRRTQT
jgi:hypothetical protein